MFTKNPLIRQLSAQDSLKDHMSPETTQANAVIGVKQAGWSTEYRSYCLNNLKYKIFYHKLSFSKEKLQILFI